MPEKTPQALADNGDIGTMTPREGAAAFVKSWEELLAPPRRKKRR